ncbi:GntR family transcriptional regulator [bacterium]|nr:GntR family transcriptional regulator [bacterium]
MTSEPLHPLSASTPLAEQAYQKILQHLADGAAGERLVEREVGDALSMSRTPVREALRRLVSEGLIRRTPGAGYIPRRFTHRDVFDHFDLRLLFESEAAAMSAAQSYEESDELLTRLQDTSESSDFHLAVAAASGNDALLSVIGILIEHPLGRLLTGGRRPTTGEEDNGHQRILRCIREHDATEARNAMRAHLAALRDCSERAVATGRAAAPSVSPGSGSTRTGRS